jgi:hypothetical protein
MQQGATTRTANKWRLSLPVRMIILATARSGVLVHGDHDKQGAHGAFEGEHVADRCGRTRRAGRGVVLQTSLPSLRVRMVTAPASSFHHSTAKFTRSTAPKERRSRLEHFPPPPPRWGCRTR